MKKTISVIFYFQVIFFLLFLFVSLPIYALSNNTIRVAILDSFYNEMPLIPLAYKYETAYLQGVQAAAYTAKHEDFNIQSQFFYTELERLISCSLFLK